MRLNIYGVIPILFKMNKGFFTLCLYNDALVKSGHGLDNYTIPEIVESLVFYKKLNQ